MISEEKIKEFSQNGAVILKNVLDSDTGIINLKLRNNKRNRLIELH